MIAFLGRFLITSAVIRLNPEDFFKGSFLQLKKTSPGEKARGGEHICSGETRKLSTSWVFLGEDIIMWLEGIFQVFQTCLICLDQRWLI